MRICITEHVVRQLGGIVRVLKTKGKDPRVWQRHKLRDFIWISPKPRWLFGGLMSQRERRLEFDIETQATPDPFTHGFGEVQTNVCEIYSQIGCWIT